jgi:hypothetical protein
MAYAPRAMFVGADNIIQAYSDLCPADICYYSIWMGKDILTQYNGSDRERGINDLTRMLQNFEDNGNTDLLTIKMHNKLDKGGYITSSTPAVSTLYVRCADLNGNSALGAVQENTGRLPYEVWKTLQSIDTGLTAQNAKNVELEKRLALIEAGNADEPDWFGRIGQIAQNPGALEVIKALISKIPDLGKLLPQAVPNIQVGHVKTTLANNAQNSDAISSNIAGNSDVRSVPANIAENGDTAEHYSEAENNIIDQSLERLGSHCDIVEMLPLLADWADSNEGMFKGLISSLKTPQS